jgi:thiamine pyrophosphate-dependent acetolactate synthase large subunit-like protein
MRRCKNLILPGIQNVIISAVIAQADRFENNILKKLLNWINEAKRPFVIFGQGIILGKAENEFKKFIEKGGIPAAWTILGLSALPSDHPLNVGMFGYAWELWPQCIDQ